MKTSPNLIAQSYNLNMYEIFEFRINHSIESNYRVQHFLALKAALSTKYLN